MRGKDDGGLKGAGGRVLGLGDRRGAQGEGVSVLLLVCLFFN